MNTATAMQDAESEFKLQFAQMANSLTSFYKQGIELQRKSFLDGVKYTVEALNQFLLTHSASCSHSPASGTISVNLLLNYMDRLVQDAHKQGQQSQSMAGKGKNVVQQTSQPPMMYPSSPAPEAPQQQQKQRTQNQFSFSAPTQNSWKNASTEQQQQAQTDFNPFITTTQQQQQTTQQISNGNIFGTNSTFDFSTNQSNTGLFVFQTTPQQQHQHPPQNTRHPSQSSSSQDNTILQKRPFSDAFSENWPIFSDNTVDSEFVRAMKRPRMFAS